MMEAWVVIFSSELGHSARNYRWSESRSKVCQMCDMGEGEMVEYLVLKCEKYDRDRMETMHVILISLFAARVVDTYQR